MMNRKDVNGSGHGIFYYTVQHLPGDIEEKYENYQ
jgi:hypothetical protein